jgi:hypothetical protein
MSTISKVERQALEEIFITLGERKRFLDRVKSSRKEMKKMLQHLFKHSKKETKFPTKLSV